MVVDPTTSPELAGLEYLIKQTPPETRIFLLSSLMFILAGIVNDSVTIIVIGSICVLSVVARSILIRPGRPGLSSLRGDCLTLLFVALFSQWPADQDQTVDLFGFTEFTLITFYDGIKISATLIWLFAGGIARYQRPEKFSDVSVLFFSVLRSIWRMGFLLLLIHKWWQTLLNFNADEVQLIELLFALSLVFKVMFDTYLPVSSAAYKIPEYRTFEVRKTKWTRLRDSLFSTSMIVLILMVFGALTKDSFWGPAVLGAIALAIYILFEARNRNKELLTRLFGEGNVGASFKNLAGFSFPAEQDAIQIAADATMKTSEGILHIPTDSVVIPMSARKGQQQVMVLGRGELVRKELDDRVALDKATVLNVKKSALAKLEKGHKKVPLSMISPREFGLKFDNVNGLLSTIQGNAQGWLTGFADKLGLASGGGGGWMIEDRPDYTKVSLPGVNVIETKAHTIVKTMGVMVFEAGKNTMVKFPGGRVVEFGDTTFVNVGGFVRVLEAGSGTAVEIFGFRINEGDADESYWAMMNHMERAAEEFEGLLAQHLGKGSAMPDSELMLQVESDGKLKVLEQGRHERTKVLEAPGKDPLDLMSLDQSETPVLHYLQSELKGNGEERLELEEGKSMSSDFDDDVEDAVFVDAELVDPEE